MPEKILENGDALTPFGVQHGGGTGADARRVRRRVRADLMPARVEFANVPARQKTRTIDEVGRHKAVRAPTALFEAIGHLAIERLAAVVERQREGHRGFRQRIQVGEMAIELGDRKLVTIRCRRLEAAVRRSTNEDVMKQQVDSRDGVDRGERRASIEGNR